MRSGCARPAQEEKPRQQARERLDEAMNTLLILLILIIHINDTNNDHSNSTATITTQWRRGVRGQREMSIHLSGGLYAQSAY